MTPRAARCDHHVDELMLVSRQLSALDEFVEGALCSSAVQTYKETHEEAESPSPQTRLNSSAVPTHITGCIR